VISWPIVLLVLIGFGEASVQVPVQAADEIVWRDARELTLEGQAFEDTATPYGRLPARARESVRGPVWALGEQSAGLSVRFRSDGTAIRARWSLTSEQLEMKHMPSSAVSGLDLYVRKGPPGGDRGWRWLGTGFPTGKDDNEALLAKELDGEPRDYLLHLPLYNGTASLGIGVPAGSTLEPSPRLRTGRKPIVFYGTSITQGACASRPGMVHTAILGRRLDRPIVNLGFSGNGEMEPAVTALLAEIDAAVYVIDCLPNMNAEAVAERTRPLVQSLRAARPEVPILLVEDRSYGFAHLVPSGRERNLSNRVALRASFEALLESGVKDLHYLEGEGLLGSDGEATVDGSHPSDLGFMRYADAFEPVLRELLAP
jgi:hypothetical protein